LADLKAFLLSKNMSKKCANCKNWSGEHYGMIEPLEWGTCYPMTGNGSDYVQSICEGCVNVAARVTDAEIVTHKDFGCNQWKSKK
jgi:hypothetical protein